MKYICEKCGLSFNKRLECKAHEETCKGIGVFPYRWIKLVFFPNNEKNPVEIDTGISHALIAEDVIFRAELDLAKGLFLTWSIGCENNKAGVEKAMRKLQDTALFYLAKSMGNVAALTKADAVEEFCRLHLMREGEVNGERKA